MYQKTTPENISQFEAELTEKLNKMWVGFLAQALDLAGNASAEMRLGQTISRKCCP